MADHIVDDRYEFHELEKAERLNPAQVHELAMCYLDKTAYEGITPEQLVSEYFLAIEHIQDYVPVGYTGQIATEEKPQGYAWRDNIPQQ